MKVASLDTDPLAGAAKLLADINAAVGMTNQSMAEIERSALSAANAFASFGSGIGAMTAELATLGSTIADLTGRIQQMANTAQDTGATQTEIVSTALNAMTLADSFLKAAVAATSKAAATTADAAASRETAVANLAAAESNTLVTASKVAELAVTKAGIEAKIADRATSIAAVETKIAEAQATIAATQNAGALSAALRTQRIAEADLAAAQATRTGLMAEATVLGRAKIALEAQQVAATTALVGSTTQLGAAQVAASATTGGLSAAMALVGGPIGLVTLVIGAGVAAWLSWGNSATDEIAKASKATGTVDEMTRSFAALNAVQLEREGLAARDMVVNSIHDQSKALEQLVHTMGGSLRLTSAEFESFSLKVKELGNSSMSARELESALHGLVDQYSKGAPASSAFRMRLMDLVETVGKGRGAWELGTDRLVAYANALALAAGLAGKTTSALTGQKEAMDAFAKKYGNNAEKRVAEIDYWTKALKRALNADELKRINEFYKDPVTPRTATTERAGEQRVSSIRAQISEQELLTKTLARYGAQANEITAGDKLQIQIEQQLALAVKDRTGKLSDAELMQEQAAARRLSSIEHANVETQKQLKLTADQNAYFSSLAATEIALADSVAETTAAWGTSAEAQKIAAAQSKIYRDAEKQIDEIFKSSLPGALKRVEAIEAEAEAHASVVTALMQRQFAEQGAQQLHTENKRFAAERILDADQREQALLELEVEGWRKRIAATAEGSAEQKKFVEQFNIWYANQKEKPAIELARKAREAEVKGWVDLVGSIGDVFRKGFLDMLNGGEDAWKSFTKGLTTTFKTTVADLIYNMLAKPFIIQMVAGVAGLATGSESVANDVFKAAGGQSNSNGSGSLFDGAGVISKLLGGKSASSFGDKLVGTLSSLTADSLGSDGVMGTVARAVFENSEAIAGFADAAGSVLSYGGAIMAAIDGKFGTAIGTALGTAIGAYFGFGPLGAFIGSKIGGMIDKMLGGETRAGGTYRLDDAGKVQFIHGPSGGQAGAGDGVKSAMEATVTTINNTLAAIGSSLTVDAFYGAFEQSEKGRGGVMSGGQLSSGAAFGENGLGSNYKGTYYERSSTQSPDIQTALANFNTDLKQVTIQALQAAIDIPEAVKALVQGVDAEALSDEAVTALLTTINTQITEVQKFRSAIMALPFENMRDLSYDAVVSLTKLSGGLEQLSTNMTTYMEKFYSDDERAAISLNQMTVQMALLGVQLPKTREEYRKIIEAQVLTTASGQLVSAAMLEMAGQFDEWVTHTETGTKAISDAHQQVVSTMKSAYSEYLTSLQDDVDTARSAVETAYNNEASALKNTISATESFIKSLADLKKSLLLGDLSTLTPEQKYAQAKSDLDSLIGLAETGDADAQSAVPQAIQQFLELSRSYNASTEAYQRDFSQYLDAAERMRTTASSQLDIQNSQLERLKEAVKGILDVNTSVQSLNDALDAYAKAVAKKDNTSLIAPPTPTGLTAIEQAINAAYLASDGRNADAEGLAFWRDAILNGADQNAILAQIAAINKATEYTGAFAEGGYTPTGLALVGEEGPELVDFRSPGRVYTSDELARVVSGGTNGNAEVVTELRATREELADQRRENKQLMSRLINLTSAASQQASREMSEQTTALRNRNSTLIPA